MNDNKLLFTKDHEWVKIEGDYAYVGITEFAQGELGDIIFVELPNINEEFLKNDVFGTIEAVKTVADLYMPVSSKIIELNSKLENKPEIINSHPETDAWIIKVKIKDLNETKDLLDYNAYQELVN